jgi:plastocyanin
MKKGLLIISLFFGLTASLFAQTNHAVTITDNAFNPATLSITMGDMVTWTYSGSSAHTSTSGSACTGDGKWNSGTLSNGGTFSHTFSTAGSNPYFCTFHCSIGMTGSITVTSSTGIFNSKVASSSFNVFPNPFTDVVTLSVEQGNNNVTMIKITDAVGKEMKSFGMSAGQSSYSIDLSDLQPGLYFCNLYSTDGIVGTRKISRTR